jgi:uncharacterized damage-inducible protein DinB
VREHSGSKSLRAIRESSQDRWQILAHVVNHGTDHRAQVLDLLHRLGAPNVEQDLIYYLWDQPD